MSYKGMAAGAMMLAGAATAASAQSDLGVCHVQDFSTATFTHVTMDDQGGMAGFQKTNGEKFEINLAILEDSVNGNGYELSALKQQDIAGALDLTGADMLGVNVGGEVHALIDNEWKATAEIGKQYLDNGGNDVGFIIISSAASAVERIGKSLQSMCDKQLLIRTDRKGPGAGMSR